MTKVIKEVRSKKRQVKHTINGDVTIPFYVSIPGDIYASQTISPTAKLIYGHIEQLAMKDGYCWATNRHLALTQGISERAASRAVQLLVECELITVEFNWKDSKSYRHIRLTRKFKNAQNEEIERVPILSRGTENVSQNATEGVQDLSKEGTDFGLPNNPNKNLINTTPGGEGRFFFKVGKTKIYDAAEYYRTKLSERYGFIYKANPALFESVCTLYTKSRAGSPLHGLTHFQHDFDKFYEYNKDKVQVVASSSDRKEQMNAELTKLNYGHFQDRYFESVENTLNIVCQEYPNIRHGFKTDKVVEDTIKDIQLMLNDGKISEGDILTEFVYRLDMRYDVIDKWQ